MSKLHIQDDHTQDHQNPLFEIRQIPGKGRGLVVCQRISRATLLIEEKPLLTIPESVFESKTSSELESYIAARLTWMNEESQKQFSSFTTGSQNMNYPLLAKFQTNGWIHDPPGEAATSFVSATASLVNHDCQANSRIGWPADLGCVRLCAVRQIEPEEEITVDYVRGYPRAERQNELLESWNIVCNCQRCCVNPPESSNASGSDATSGAKQKAEN